MDGSIDVESELGKGSTFTVILPLKIMQQSEKHESSDSLDCIEDKTKANLDIQQNYISLMTSLEERSKHNDDTHHDETSPIIVAEGMLKLMHH